jgi:hypothetical protein
MHNYDNYGDIIKSQHLIHFVDCANPAELEAEFGRIGLVPRLEIVTAQFCILEARGSGVFKKIQSQIE